MKSTVYDRFKKTGFLTAKDSAMQQNRPATVAKSVAEATGASPSGPAGPFAPTSEDEPAPTDPAEEEPEHHGTMENPVDLVNSKLIIRLDDGQLYELKKLQDQNTPGGF